MPADPGEILYRIEAAAEDDWPWMKEATAEITWVVLSPEEQRTVSRQAIQERINQRASRMLEGDLPHQAFVVREEDRRPAAFVWVAKIRGDGQGRPESFALNLYVAESHRGRGLGQRLMEAAEDWACQRGLKIPAFGLGVPGAGDRGLYEALGYHVDRQKSDKVAAGRRGSDYPALPTPRNSCRPRISSRDSSSSKPLGP